MKAKSRPVCWSSRPRTWDAISVRLALVMVSSLVFLGLAAKEAGAQAMAAPLSDLVFEVVNGTTGQPGTVDRLEITYFSATSESILDTRPAGSEFTLPRVPIRESRPYLITAWKKGVPYFWKLRGSKLLEGKTTLHVFDTSDQLKDVGIEGLTLMVRRTESLLELEYLLNVGNAARPQVTVTKEPGAVEMALPSGATGVAAEVHRGPEPIAVQTRNVGGNRIALSAPLTTGTSKIKVTAVVPWTDGMTLPVEFNLPVKAWSLLASPENLDIQAFELENDINNDFEGHQRLIGPELAAGRSIEIRLAGGTPAGPAEDLFAKDSPANSDQSAEGHGENENTGRSSFVQFLPFVAVLIIIIAVLRRRRSST